VAPAPLGTADLDVLASCRVGDLGLEILLMPGGWRDDLPPVPTGPVRHGDPLPWLPAGLTPSRVGRMLAGVDASGEVRVTWYRCRPRTTSLNVLWSEAGGPAPELHAGVVSGLPVIWFDAGAARGGGVACVHGTARWLVTGVVPLDQLLRVAASLALV
jgi:hypothetical protein